ncbi:MAG: hypothetical protein KF746_10535 [Chitinophagaceae bacterium]|nr:hypothetical protein [Chitinophagaceae bacterium]
MKQHKRGKLASCYMRKNEQGDQKKDRTHNDGLLASPAKEHKQFWYTIKVAAIKFVEYITRNPHLHAPSLQVSLNFKSYWDFGTFFKIPTLH